MKNRGVIFVGIALVVLYFVWGTGIHLDDYVYILELKELPLGKIIFPDLQRINMFVFAPVSYYIMMPVYYFCSNSFILGYDFVKFIFTIASMYCIFKFSSDYLPESKAVLFSVFYVLIPIHDSSMYVFNVIQYMLGPALIFYSHYLINHQRNGCGIFFGIFGGFMGYFSPPFSVGLSSIYFLKKDYRRASLFLIPSIIYVIYYFVVSANLSRTRIASDITLISLIKQYFLQIASFLDAAIGPSFFLKIWYSITAIHFYSIIAAVFIALILFGFLKIEKFNVSRTMLWGLIIVTILAFGMFALTGMYPQMAFNTGNRVMIYGSSLIAYLLILVTQRKMLYLFVLCLFFLSVAGLSDHWKDFAINQEKIKRNIVENEKLKRLTAKDILLVSNNSYSKLGPFSHVEFLSEGTIVRFFTLSLGYIPKYQILAVNDRFYVDKNNYIIDKKYDFKLKLNNKNYKYDSSTDNVTEISDSGVGPLILSEQKSIRHWVQILGDSSLKKVLLFFMPRLNYLFTS